MAKSFSFNFNSNLQFNGKKVFSSNTNDKKDLTPQQEYWLNRLLREYGNKAFLLIVLFIVLLIAIVYFSSTQTPLSTGSQVNIYNSNQVHTSSTSTVEINIGSSF